MTPPSQSNASLRHPRDASAAIAIVGIGCRYPGGVRGPKDLVRFLEDHGDGIVAVPADRWSVERTSSTSRDVPGRAYVTRGGFLQGDIYSFDPAPFGLSPREAEYMDPQQRLLLEATLDGLEDAGLSPQALRGSSTGVYVGGFNVDMRDVAAHPDNAKRIRAHTATGSSHTILSNRVSYTFDWHGPSFTVDTACSSSLVATHYACRDLVEGRSDLAVAAGVNVMLSPLSTTIMCAGRFLAPDGRSKAFDASADGYGRGEGVGLVVLRRLDEAIARGERIYAVILATGVNQDGQTDGLPMPNERAQAALCREVAQRAGIEPATVGFVEAHGTGTQAGDPIEARALAAVYAGANRKTLLPVGSIKTNIGHLEAAAGVTGLIKAALSLHHRRLYPLRALGRVNPAIDLDALKLRIPVEAEPWPDPLRRVAAVNSFGYGGTNAHAVLCAPDECIALDAGGSAPPRATSPALRAALVTAYDEAGLRAVARQALAHEDPAEVLRASWSRRGQLPARAFAHGAREADVLAALRALADAQPHAGLQIGTALSERPRVLWLFTGMGPQWWGMGQSLYASQPVFRKAARRVDAHFRGVAGWSLLDAILDATETGPMRSNRIAQPANFLLQVGLVELLRHHGVEPTACLGHSVGEVAAAWAAGALDLETATALSFHRSDVQQRTAGQGTMAAVALSVAEAQRWCELRPELSLAAVNGNRSVALAGTHAALEELVRTVTEEGRFARMLTVEVAYHSTQMDPLRDELVARLESIRYQAPTIPLFSTARGERVEDAVHDATYWWQNVRRPVLLDQALREALATGVDTVVEIGPHPVLRQIVAATARDVGQRVTIASCQDRRQDGEEQLLRCLGTLACAGVPLDRTSLQGEGAEAALPLYPFQRQRLWFEPPEHMQRRIGAPHRHPLLDRMDGDVHRTELAGPHLDWIGDHRVDGATVFPAAAFIEAARAACAEAAGVDREVVIERLAVEAPLVVDPQEPPELEVTVRDGGVEVASRTETGRTVHARARFSGRGAYRRPEPRPPVGVVWSACDTADLYEELAVRGLHYGPAFRRLIALEHGGDQLRGTVDNGGVPDRYGVFPAVLDAAFQALLIHAPAPAGAFIPTGARTLYIDVRDPLPDRLELRATTREHDGDLVADLHLFRPDGSVVVAIDELVCRPVAPQDDTAPERWFHECRWDDVEIPAAPARTGPVIVLGQAPHVEAALRRVGRTIGAELRDVRPGTDVVMVVPSSAPEALAGSLERIRSVALRLREVPDAQLTLVCGGACPAFSASVDPGQSAAVGLGRVLMTELPELSVRVVDLDADADPTVAGVVLSGTLDEEEVAVRGAQVRARRIVRARTARARHREHARPPHADEVYELFVETRGRLDSLAYRPRAFPSPLGADEVEIDVEAASLNFKDVMKALDGLADAALERTYLGSNLGLDAAGAVRRVGENVRDLAPGDLVFAFAPGAFSNRLRVDQRYAVRAARGHSARQACAYAVFQTAWLSLVEKAKLEPGEHVLIHSAAGAVGLCAVQLAQHRGAVVHATAGTEDKRELLRSMGIDHVYDSRTLDFSREVARATRGRGVDVIVSALAGDAFVHNLELLAPGGRHVELGKQAFVGRRELPLAVFHRAISLMAVDVDRMAFERPDAYRPLATAVVRAFEEGIFTPIPTRAYRADQAEEAFRQLASGTQIGKAVLSFAEPVAAVRPAFARRPTFSADRTYLVTGGLGGFGAKTAERLLEEGAGRVVVASRRGEPSSEQRRAFEAAAVRTGGRVDYARLDVTVADEVRALVGELAGHDLPLGGIIHSAMVLDDASLGDLSEPQLARVLGPKALGAYHLHQATEHLDLECFVLFSSVSGMVGNPGQGAYAAANAFVDGLAHRRRAAGLPATSIQWGAIADAGVVARDASVESHLQRVGILPMESRRALDGLCQALRDDATECGIIDIDWDRWVRTTPETSWKRLVEVRGARDGEGGVAAMLARRLVAAQDPEASVTALLVEAAAPVLKVDPARVEADRSLRDYGVDSLMALELQAAIETVTGVELSTLELLSGKAFRTLGALVRSRLDAPTGRAPHRDEVLPSHAPFSPAAGIGVTAPYLALEDVRFDDAAGHWCARAAIAPPHPSEAGPLGLGEAARHATLLASIAARAQLEGTERYYFPVATADMIRCASSAGTSSMRSIQVVASCSSVEVASGSARCEASVWTSDGRELAAFRLQLHVVPAARFQSLFASHERPPLSQPSELADPYVRTRPLPAVRRVVDGAAEHFEAHLGPVDPRWCRGHFDRHPAYPVSIMARDAVALVAEARRARGTTAPFRIVGGTCTAARFAFAGQPLSLRAMRAVGGNARERWQVTITADDEVAATFDMQIR